MNYVFDAKEKYKERDRRIMDIEQSMNFIWRSYNYAKRHKNLGFSDYGYGISKEIKQSRHKKDDVDKVWIWMC